MAKLKFEEDDTVAYFSRTRGLRIGLINEIFSDDSDDSDDDSSDDASLKPDQVRVEWYPTGKETVANCENLKLVDRTLLLGELVRPIDDLKKIGFVSSVSVSCDIMLLPFGQLVVRNVGDKRINFVQKFGDSNSDPKYILYDNWVGYVSMFSQTLTLKSQRGYKCKISTSDSSFDLIDASVHRVENSAFDDNQWYEGQAVKCTFGGLQKAVWLNEPKSPSDSFFKRINAEANANHKAYFVIEKVVLESVNVHWISPVSGVQGDLTAPDLTIENEKLEKIRLINRYEHQFVQIGDRIMIEPSTSDEIVVHHQWKEMLRDEILGFNSNKECSKSNEMSEADSTAIKVSIVSIESDKLDKLQESCLNDDAQMWTDCESGVEDQENENGKGASVGKPLVVNNISSTKSTSAVASKLLKKLKPTFKVDRLATVRKRKTSTSSSIVDGHKHKQQPVLVCDKRAVQYSQTYCGEAVFVRSYVNVMFQDGTTVERMPTSKLAYAEADLDEHVFFPGSFVLLQVDKDNLWPPEGYGVVEKVDVENRLASVSWFQVALEKEANTSKIVLLKADQVSIYELVLHPDFQYTSSSLVMRIENLKVIGEVYVGQVLYTDKSGRILVQWISGDTEYVYPQEICKLSNDDAEWSQQSDNLSDESESVGDSDDSWSTVEEFNDDIASDVDCDDEDEDNLGLSSIHDESCKKRVNFESIMNRLSSVPEKLRDAIVELRKLNDNDVGPRKQAVRSVLRLYGVIKKMHSKYYGKPIASHPFNDDLKICLARFKQWLAALAAKSASGRRRKERFSDSLSDDSTTYLDDELDKVAKTEAKVRDHIEKPSVGGVVSSRHCSKRLKSDGRMGDTFQVFLRLLLQFFTRFLGVSRLLKPARHVDTAQTERLIQSLRDNPVLDEIFSNQSSSASSSSNALVISSPSSNTDANDNEEVAQGLNENIAGDIFAQKLIEAQMAISGSGYQSCVDFMAFMTNSMSAMLQNKVQMEHVEDAPDSIAVVASIDVVIVSTLMIFQLIVSNFFELNKSDKSEEPKGEDEFTEIKKDVVEVSSKSTDHSKEEDGDKSVISGDHVDTMYGSQSFEMLVEPPSNHTYVNEVFDPGHANTKFLKTVKHELKVLQSSLTHDIFVKSYERRMDLFSVMIRGAAGTPFSDGLFLFDIRLRPSYPADPPLVFYRAFASEQLNPNLYQDGKVCVSLLGTWSGKDSEVWNPGSNLLQVLVSIQGLILNAEPYFNEAGYEARRALEESVEKSRCYNEMALIRSTENLVNIASCLPPPFENEIKEHLRCRGHRLIEQVRTFTNNTKKCDFPLQPVSLGCSMSANKQLLRLEQILAQIFT